MCWEGEKTVLEIYDHQGTTAAAFSMECSCSHTSTDTHDLY